MIQFIIIFSNKIDKIKTTVYNMNHFHILFLNRPLPKNSATTSNPVDFFSSKASKNLVWSLTPSAYFYLI